MQISQDTRHFLNATFNYNELTVTHSTTAQSKALSDLGLVVSTNSACKVFGVKSDRATTDGYLALPLTTKSTEFFVAAWPSVFAPFLRLLARV